MQGAPGSQPARSRSRSLASIPDGYGGSRRTEFAAWRDNGKFIEEEELEGLLLGRQAYARAHRWNRGAQRGSARMDVR
jgi:hypothetical protein